MPMKHKFFWFCFTVLLLLFVVPSSLSETQRFGVFSDSGCSSHVSGLDWGAVSVGEAVTKTFHVKNLDAKDLIQLSYYMENLSPQNAEGFLHLEGTPSNVNLKQNESAKIDLTLSVDSTIKNVDLFSFDLVVVADFSESLAADDEVPPSPSYGGGKSQYDDEYSVTIPAEETKTIDNDDLLLIGIAGLFVYFVFIKKK